MPSLIPTTHCTLLATCCKAEGRYLLTFWRRCWIMIMIGTCRALKDWNLRSCHIAVVSATYLVSYLSDTIFWCGITYYMTSVLSLARLTSATILSTNQSYHRTGDVISSHWRRLVIIAMSLSCWHWYLPCHNTAIDTTRLLSYPITSVQ